MTCNCDKNPHDYICQLTPKCPDCKTRTDFEPYHSFNCQFKKNCDSCGTNLNDSQNNHPYYCQYHIQCEFCGIKETLVGSIHHFGCPKWYHEYNQRRIELLRTKILNTQFNLNEFRKANITLNTDFMIPIPCLRHITHKTNKDCPICLQPNSDCRINCGHFYHKGCLEEWLKISQNCPICRKVNFF